MVAYEAARPMELETDGSPPSSRLGAALLVLAPLLVLGSSASEPVAMFARVLMMLILGVAIMRLRSERLVRWGTAVCIGGMVAAGLVRAEWSRTSTWTALAQALILLAVVGSPKVVRLDASLRAWIGLSLALFAGTSLVVSLLGAGSVEFDESFVLGPFGNPNAFGMASLAVGLLSFRLLQASQPSAFRAGMAAVVATCSAAILLSGSRTALVAGLAFLVTQRLGRALRMGRATLVAAILTTMLAVPLVTVGYALYLTDPANDMDVGEVTVGNKEVLSGRNYIWPIVMLRVIERPVTGHGLGRTPGDELPGHFEGLSSHNGYLQILFQGGAVALAFYLGLLIVLFRRSLALEPAVSRASGVAALCAAMICELFEVILTQNHFGIGLVFWIAAIVTVVPDDDRSSAPAPLVDRASAQA